ncbi:RNA-binding domain-containing protein [Corynebacterium propinquum]|uniref:RNA-binding domain-containing protein n=1 Tax=Corynebacterium propinquum TaxID=43769 RepID=UPI0003A3EEBF|nr:RNA-binding domain-containing protein [Corynebacterium propinquum]MDK4251502.1 ATP-binding protein [Corynebacterium propinquum]MDK4292114.1 ATP-binding protein [Corynebacterium propinquum]MDK4320206.1 ATP-binding protein [Corynebacterium propinquum]QQU91423.1 putative DNA binding domain-containing protein [Corynebacterium propinquum]
MNWTLESLTEQLAELRRLHRDSTDIEVKRASELPGNLPETTCSFANMPSGGTIILGVDESRDFEVVGVADAAALEEAIISQTRNSVKPAPMIECETFTLEGKQVLVAQVNPVPLQNRPAHYRGVAYLRQSDGDYEMNDADLALVEIQKLSHSENFQFDVVPVLNSSTRDLDSVRVKSFLEAARAGSRILSKKIDDQELLETLNIVTVKGELTLAGIYALGEYPQGKAPQLRITTAVQLPREGSSVRTRNMQDFEGPLPDLLESALAWVKQNAPTRNVYDSSGNMRKESVYPLPAVRELIANALVHRDLSPNSDGKWVEIRLRDDRLVISNPGGLRGVSVKQLESATLSKNAVNPRLYDIAKRVRTEADYSVIEGEGAGIQEVLRQTRQALLAKPQLIDTGVQFTAILYGASVFSEAELEWLRSIGGDGLTAVEKHLLVGLRKGESWHLSRILNEFSPITVAEAEKLMHGLKKRGFIESDNKTFTLGAHSENQAPRVEKGETILAKITKNAPTIARALELKPKQNFDELLRTTGLSQGQLRYALDKLQGAGLIVREGGWGVHGTTYRWSVQT